MKGMKRAIFPLLGAFIVWTFTAIPHVNGRPVDWAIEQCVGLLIGSALGFGANRVVFGRPGHKP